jgi:hypothetical protein
MDMFETYYPPSLVDWWMDDWVTKVYGRSRTVRLEDVGVMHATSLHGTRYSADLRNVVYLEVEVEQGSAIILRHMVEHGASRAALEAFANDQFEYELKLTQGQINRGQ